MKTISEHHEGGLRKGFTLFELVLALAIGAMVLTSIFKIADGAVKSTTTMVDYQDQDITRDAFFSFLRNHFDDLPGNAVLNLFNLSDSQPYQSEMIFQNTPVAFNWGGVPISAQATRLVTLPTVNGGLDVVLEYYDVPILDSEEGFAEGDVDPIASITLLYDVRMFEWSLIDLRQYDSVERDEWPYEWDEPNRRPGYIELTVQFEAGDPLIKRLFWLPNKANPQSTMAALENAARNARNINTGGGSPGGNPGDQNPGDGNPGDRPGGPGGPNVGGPNRGGGRGGGQGGGTPGAAPGGRGAAGPARGGGAR